MSGIIILNGLLFGLGLAVDVFIMALTDGLDYPDIKRAKLLMLAMLFSAFNIIMPMLGWLCMHTISVYVPYFDEALSWIAFGVMTALGAKMIVDGVRKRPPKPERRSINVGAIILQCFVTSVDSLAVGFVIANYTVAESVVCAIVISAVTFLVFCLGFIAGRRCGLRYARIAYVIGGIAFIGIGAEILITSFL